MLLGSESLLKDLHLRLQSVTFLIDLDTYLLHPFQMLICNGLMLVEVVDDLPVLLLNF